MRSKAGTRNAEARRSAGASKLSTRLTVTAGCTTPTASSSQAIADWRFLEIDMGCGSHMSISTADRLTHLALHDVPVPAERGAERRWIDDEIPVAEQVIAAPSYVGDESEGGAAS